MNQRRKADIAMQTTKDMKAKQREELLRALKARFEKNMNRHKGLEWAKSAFHNLER
jgi:aconitase A